MKVENVFGTTKTIELKVLLPHHGSIRICAAENATS